MIIIKLSLLYTNPRTSVHVFVAKYQMQALQRGFLGFVSEQTQYNLLNRYPELEVLPAALDFGIGILAYMPLGGGLLTGKIAATEGSRTSDVEREYELDLSENRQFEAFSDLCREIGEKEFVVAARGIGAANLRIIVLHILPMAIGPIIVEATLEVGWAIMEEAGLSFLGFGIRPPTPSWGNLLSNAQEHLTRHPWLAIFPGLMIFLTIISINYIGDGLRDAFDPFKVFGGRDET